MLAPEQISSLNGEIALLVAGGHADEAVTLVRENPLIFRHLPDELRDNELFALTAMSRLLECGNCASPRLKRSIDFFIKAFNAHYYFLHPIDLVSAHDTIFMLAFSTSHGYYHHEIREDDVTGRFWCSEREARQEIRMAQGLIGLARSPDGWLTSDKSHDIERLESQAPGFAGYSYEYAFMWAYGDRSARIRGQYP